MTYKEINELFRKLRTESYYRGSNRTLPSMLPLSMPRERSEEERSEEHGEYRILAIIDPPYPVNEEDINRYYPEFDQSPCAWGHE